MVSFINPSLCFSRRETMKGLKQTTSKFVKVRCPKCKNEQIIFGRASTSIKCLICQKILADPTGGKSKVKARVLEVLE